MSGHHYRIEEVAKRTGLTKRAIRYYEDIELIKPIRTESQYRLYSEEDIERISRIRSFKDSMGFCLNEVKEILDMEVMINNITSGQNRNEEEVRGSVEAIEAQIDRIERKEKNLSDLKAKYQVILCELKKKL